jgi:DNA-binding NtrC family response regulator
VNEYSANAPSSTLAESRSVPILETREGLKDIARRAAREGERQALVEVLERVRWNRAAAARILKVSYKTLLTKMAIAGLGTKRQERGTLR